MKQHVTLEDIKVLDTAIFVPLIENGHIKHEGLFRSNAFVKKLTIGKMIEVLDKECFDYKIFKQMEGYDTVTIEKTKNGFSYGFNSELCDALYEALCYVLEGEV